MQSNNINEGLRTLQFKAPIKSTLSNVMAQVLLCHGKANVPLITLAMAQLISSALVIHGS